VFFLPSLKIVKWPSVFGGKGIHETFFFENTNNIQPNRDYEGTFGDVGLYLVKNTMPAMAYY